ncbi:MAG: hypothetical protein AMXMBFR7_49100 [Planctomycetota bacterium]
MPANELDGPILQFLSSCGTCWTPLDPTALSAHEALALSWITGAGLIERRISFQLRLAGAKDAIEATVVVTGEHGLAEALEGVLAEAWALWEREYKRQREACDGPGPKALCEYVKAEAIRVTSEGVQAQADVSAGEVQRVLDFVKKSGPFGPLSPLALSNPSYLAGVGRPPVRGHGRAEHIEVKRDAPLPVFVANLSEIAEPLSRLADSILAEKARSAVPQWVCFRIDPSAKEVWHGAESLTSRLNETTRNFLAVLALNKHAKSDYPVPMDRPFDARATATARSAVDMLRRQIGNDLVKALLRTERQRGEKSGGVRLSGRVEVVGMGGFTVNTDPESVHAAQQDRTGRTKRQRAKFDRDEHES